MRRHVLTAALLCAVSPAAAQLEAPGTIAGLWDRGPTAGTRFLMPPSGGAGPVLGLREATDEDGAPPGDYRAPILQPWAAEVVKRRGENVSGAFQAEPKESCSPMGVPHIMQLNGPIQIVMNGNQTVILYMRAMQARIIEMNKPHPADLKPSYHGHSVGHWEGDTLVVDTVGFNSKTPIDMFGTPHTERLHVVERYRVTNGGKTLRVDFTVEDPGAFTTKWSSAAEYGAPRDIYFELVCMENNRLIDGSLVPGSPYDDTPDF
jgi:hypothetical protein